MSCGCNKSLSASASTAFSDLATKIEADYWNRRKRQTIGSFPYRGVIRLSEDDLDCYGAFLLRRKGCKALSFPKHFNRNKIPVTAGTFHDSTDIAGLIYFVSKDGCCKVFKDITRGPGEQITCDCYNIKGDISNE